MTLIHVVEPHENADVLPELAMSHVDRVEKAAAQTLEKMAEAIEGVNVHVVVCTGSAHREIIRNAGEQDANLIVMATHGRTGLSHMVFGSVSERTIRSAPCPVLIIRPTEPGAESESKHGNAAEYFG